MSGIKLDLIEIGKIIKPFGIKGGLNILFYIDQESDFKNLKEFYINDENHFSGFRKLVVLSLKFCENIKYAKVLFSGVFDRTEAEKIRSMPIYIESSYLEDPQEGQYFIKDLLGLQCFYKDELFGIVENLITIAGQDIFIINLLTDKQITIPFNDRYISLILISEKKIIFDDIEDLL